MTFVTFSFIEDMQKAVNKISDTFLTSKEEVDKDQVKVLLELFPDNYVKDFKAEELVEVSNIGEEGLFKAMRTISDLVRRLVVLKESEFASIHTKIHQFEIKAKGLVIKFLKKFVKNIKTNEKLFKMFSETLFILNEKALL